MGLNNTPSAPVLQVTINCSAIEDWDSFHRVFAEAFGFPSFYGRNMNAWIDCMSSLDEPDDGMSNIHCLPGQTMVLQLQEVEAFKCRCPDQYDALVECSAFVNLRRIEVGRGAILALSFYL